MPYEIASITPNLYALAVFDDSWGSYNNVYVLRTEDETILVDSGKAEHAHMLVRSLTLLDISPGKVSKILLTHGHSDHIGGATAFSKAKILMHPLDRRYLKEDALQGELCELAEPPHRDITFFSVGQHSRGSVVYYHSTTRALFCGDYITFFAEPITPGQLVIKGEHLQARCKESIGRWLNSPLVKARTNTEGFRKQLLELSRLDIEFLCTGHGPVLQGDISLFLRELSEL
jgi:glyoxylase-like metal-dependent hydrolase (beta-lactamase superfamily II)